MLHIDKNDYYGGAEAALSLQEAEAWADTVNEGKVYSYPSEMLLKDKQVHPSEMPHIEIWWRKERQKRRETTPQS